MRRNWKYFKAKKVLRVMIYDLEYEARLFYTRIVKRNWKRHPKHFSRTLYAYMMTCFAYVDLFSSYWKGNDSNQTPRMIEFMVKYLGLGRLESELAVQVWRHKLMHTSEPRWLAGTKTGTEYGWLLHWSTDQLPREEHFSWQVPGSGRKQVLQLNLLSLIEDLRRGVEKYLQDLSTDPSLQKKWYAFDSDLEVYDFKGH